MATRQLQVLRSQLKLLGVIDALSPLLGLLGTVLGMIKVFQQLAVAGGFTIDRSGRILNYQVERGTSFPLLDQQALHMLEKANPLPPMPDDLQRSRMEVALPVAFNLN